MSTVTNTYDMIIHCMVDIIRKYIISIVSFCAGISFNQYLTYLPVPTVSSAQCNSSAVYAGQLGPAMLCSAANGDSRTCHVSPLTGAHCRQKLGGQRYLRHYQKFYKTSAGWPKACLE